MVNYKGQDVETQQDVDAIAEGKNPRRVAAGIKGAEARYGKEYKHEADNYDGKEYTYDDKRQDQPDLNPPRQAAGHHGDMKGPDTRNLDAESEQDVDAIAEGKNPRRVEAGIKGAEARYGKTYEHKADNYTPA